MDFESVSLKMDARIAKLFDQRRCLQCSKKQINFQYNGNCPHQQYTAYTAWIDRQFLIRFGVLGLGPIIHNKTHDSIAKSLITSDALYIEWLTIQNSIDNSTNE